MRGFILDFDGTLVDSMHLWDNIGAEYLAHRGIATIPADLRETLKPMSLLQAAEYLIGQFYLPASPQEIMDEVNSMIEDKYRYAVELKDGVKTFLEKYKHVRMCIATATDRHLVEAALERLGIENSFRFVITSTEVGNSKQSPDIFLRAAERLGLAVADTVVFEDALHAIVTAKAAGFYTVGVYEAVFEAEQDEIRRAADAYVHNLGEYEDE